MSSRISNASWLPGALPDCARSIAAEGTSRAPLDRILEVLQAGYSRPWLSRDYV